MDSSPFSTEPRESPEIAPPSVLSQPLVTPPLPPSRPQPVAQTPVPPSRSGLAARLLTAAIGIPAVLLLAWMGGIVFRLFCIALALGAMRELQVAIRKSDLLSNTRLVGAIAYPTILWTMVSGLTPQWPFFLLATLLTAGVMFYGRRTPISLASLAMTLLATLYVSLFALLPTLREAGNGELFYLTLLTVWASDTAAYFGGRVFGRTSLSALSPGKTQEGFLCGVLAALIVAAFIGSKIHFGAPQGILMGAAIAAAAPLGDLAESFWKRELGVKDLGTIFPGHGGILDRCDSILFATLGIWIYIALLMSAINQAQLMADNSRPRPLSWRDTKPSQNLWPVRNPFELR